SRSRRTTDMPPRALAAAAVLTAALVGPAHGQAPAGFARVGEPAPIGPPAGAAASTGNPFFSGGAPGGSAVMAMPSGPVVAGPRPRLPQRPPFRRRTPPARSSRPTT